MKFAFLIFFFALPTLATGIVGMSVDPANKMNFSNDKLNPFTSDGCSAWHNGPSENPNLWLDCCIEHDSKYWLGGTSDQKDAADDGLYECVKSKGAPGEAQLMYLGVKAGGGPLRETDYRWGYGWTRMHDYHELTEGELDQAKKMYGENLEDLEKLVKSRTALVPEPQDHTYIPKLNYTFCEEEVLSYLNENLKTATTITDSNSKYDFDHLYHAKLKLSFCDKPIDFVFNENTSANTCNHDYKYSQYKNKISKVIVPKDCQGKL